MPRLTEEQRNELKTEMPRRVAEGEKLSDVIKDYATRFDLAPSSVRFHYDNVKKERKPYAKSGLFSKKRRMPSMETIPLEETPTRFQATTSQLLVLRGDPSQIIEVLRGISL